MTTRFIAATGILLLLSDQSSALAYCTEGKLYTSSGAVAYDIPVYMVAPTSTFLGYNRDLVRHHIQLGLDAWNEESGSNIRPYWAGYVSSEPSNITNGAVYVLETTSCSICGGDADSDACEQTLYNLVPPGVVQRTGSKIWFQSGCDTTWSLSYNAQLASILAIFTHEFGHSLGLEDEYFTQCEGTFWASSMSALCPDGRTITRRDIGGLQSLYGQRVRTYTYKQSSDGGITWVAGSPSGGGTEGWMRISTVGAPIFSFGAGSVEVYGQSMLNRSPLYSRAWKGTPGSTYSSWLPWSSNSSRSWDVAGGAQRDQTAFAIAYRPYEDETNCNKGMVVSATNNSGSTWTNREARTPDNLTFFSFEEGVSVAYDPVQDVYVAFFLKNSENGDGPGVVVSQTFDRATLTRYPFTEHGWGSLDAPVVACNHTNYAPGNNCMVAWMDTDDGTSVRWVRGYVNASKQFVFGSTTATLGYTTWQSPSLAARDSSTYPFQIGIKQQETFFTWRYSASSNSFVNQATAIFDSSGIVSGALGTYVGELNARYIPL